MMQRETSVFLWSWVFFRHIQFLEFAKLGSFISMRYEKLVSMTCEKDKPAERTNDQMTVMLRSDYFH